MSAFFAFGIGEFAEEVFANVAKDVLGVQCGVGEGDGGHEVDEAGQCLVHPAARVVLVQHALEFRVFFLDGFERLVQQEADAFEFVVKDLAVFDLELGSEGDLGRGP